MCERVTGRLAKDGPPCPVCEGAVPPSLGVKPRKYCSLECCRKAQKGVYLRNLEQHACCRCGVVLQYKGRGPRRKIKCKECKKYAKDAYRDSRVRACVCGRCGVEFASRYKKQFCSKRCQHKGRGGIHGDFVPCEKCGKPFRQTCREKRFCSRKCSRPAKKYNCLNCGIEFHKRRFKSGSTSCQTKYCTRECAFEARRLKKPCAQRPQEIAKRLAIWLLSWGDDQWPMTSKCRECGDPFTAQAHAGAERQESCSSCRRRVARVCAGCGCGIEPGVSRRCDPCRRERRSEIRRAERRRRRKAGGGEGSYRQRCKKYGAPYTKVSRKAVLDRDGWQCVFCGVALLRGHAFIAGTKTPHPRCPTIDHIVPLSFGPSSPGHVFDNCQAACWVCNCERGVEAADSFARRKATSQYL